MEDKIVKIAKQIIELEKKAQGCGDTTSVENSMVELISGLSFEELMLVDEYITTTNVI